MKYDLRTGRVMPIREVFRILEERQRQTLERVIALRRRKDLLYVQKDELLEVLARYVQE